MSAKSALQKPATPLSREQFEIYEAMSKQGQELALWTLEKIRKGAITNILRYYEIGARHEDAAKQEAQYGSNYFRQLALLTGIPGGEGTFYRFRLIARTFEAEFVVQMSNRTMASGGTLDLGHWYELAKLDSPNVRKKMLERIFRESLGVNQLREVIAAEGLQLTHTRKSPGRKPTPPASPVVGLSRFQKKTEALFRTRDDFLGHVLQPLLEMPADKVNEDLLEAVEATRAQAEKLAAEGAQYLADLEKVKARIVAVLADVETAAEAEEDETPAVPAKTRAAGPAAAAAARRSTGGRAPAPTKPPRAAGKKPAAAKKTGRKPTRRAGEEGGEFHRPTPTTI